MSQLVDFEIDVANKTRWNKLAPLLEPTVQSETIDSLLHCPRASQGVHRWLFKMAAELHRHYPDKKKLAELLAAAVEPCGRQVPFKEIEDAITNSRPEQLAAVESSCRAWPQVDKANVAAVVSRGFGARDLIDASPIRFDDKRSHADEVIDILFPGDPLLCVGLTTKTCETRSRKTWRGLLQGLQFMVPSPMRALIGKTRDGRTSRRCLDNVGPRKFLVIEHDPLKWDELEAGQRAGFSNEQSYYETKRDEQASILWHLAEFAPLALVVHSGGKSLHGWFACKQSDEQTQLRFMRYAVALGADTATWTKCQPVRLPEGKRDNGKKQSVIYCNPKSL